MRKHWMAAIKESLCHNTISPKWATCVYRKFCRLFPSVNPHGGLVLKAANIQSKSNLAPKRACGGLKKSGRCLTNTMVGFEMGIKQTKYKEACPTPYLPVPVMVMDSEAYKRASDKAIRMLFDIARPHNALRGNNGHLSGARTYLKTRGWRSAKKIHSALQELQELGLIEQTKVGGLNRGSHLFALTWLPISNYTGLDIDFFRPGAWLRLQSVSPIKNTGSGLVERQGTSQRETGNERKTGCASPAGEQEKGKKLDLPVSQGGTKNIAIPSQFLADKSARYPFEKQQVQ